MNDLNVIEATLKRAIHALETRESPLSPLENMKLKSLRLNLEAAERASPIVAVPPAIPSEAARGHMCDPLDEKFRALHARSVKIHIEAVSLMQDMHLNIARARVLTHDLRLALTDSEENCARISDTLGITSQSGAAAPVMLRHARRGAHAS